MQPIRLVVLSALAGVAAACALAAPAYAAGPEVVAGPSADPHCFAPWSDKTKFFKFPA